jgi:NAD(P)-dependent dehydrogenase (short-subunit alcohol dehydrogenase family)
MAMAQRALVIGGAGKVGCGVVEAFRDAGFEVVVVDPAGGDLAAKAGPDLLDRVGSADVAVVSLPARGEGRESGQFRPAEAASRELPGRLPALELAVKSLQGGVLVELSGGAVLEQTPDEPGLIGRWQRGIHAGFAQAGIRSILCAITCYVDPEADAQRIGDQIVKLAGSDRTGLCRLGSADGPPEWVD